MSEIVVEWFALDEPHRARARVEVRDGDRVLLAIENVTREQIDAVAGDFTATESEMRWHEARWFEANGHQAAFGRRAKQHIVAACGDPEHARPLCGVRPVGFTDRTRWDRVWPLVDEPRNGGDRCALCWRRYARCRETSRAGGQR